MNWGIWIAALLAYALFAAWYFNWKGPLTGDEIEALLPKVEASSPTDPDVLRAFLEADDGKAFTMVNLVRFHEGKVAHPDTGVMMRGGALVQDYYKPFAAALIKRGGHPVMIARVRGGAIDSWNTSEERFDVVGSMRYRSRRDLMALLTDPRFGDAHVYKLAAIDGTTSVPTQVSGGVALHPQAWVPMVLILLASLAQNAAFLWRG